jgi:hypothetical protein
MIYTDNTIVRDDCLLIYLITFFLIPWVCSYFYFSWVMYYNLNLYNAKESDNTYILITDSSLINKANIVRHVLLNIFLLKEKQNKK